MYSQWYVLPILSRTVISMCTTVKAPCSWLQECIEALYSCPYCKCFQYHKQLVIVPQNVLKGGWTPASKGAVVQLSPGVRIPQRIASSSSSARISSRPGATRRLPTCGTQSAELLVCSCSWLCSLNDDTRAAAKQGVGRAAVIEFPVAPNYVQLWQGVSTLKLL